MVDWVRFVFAAALLIAFGPPAATQPPDPAIGRYIVHIPETATAFEIRADGRFQWAFSQGALDLFGQGRWSRDGDVLVLTSDPAVVAPDFELVGSARDDRPGLLIRLADEASAWRFLLIEAEFADGSRSSVRMPGALNRFPAEPRIVAVRIGSDLFDFVSERFPVDVDRANVMTFRFIANDLGRVDFDGQRVSVEPEGLSMAWRGMDLRYVREDPFGAGGAAPCPPVGEPRSVDAGLGEPLAEAIARSTHDLGGGPADFGSPGSSECQPVRLTIRFREHRLDAGLVGGSELFDWSLRLSAETRIEGIEFAYQDRLLSLDEALDRARSLRAWLESAGFVEHPAPDAPDDRSYRSFQLMDGASSGELAGDWEEARRRLADEEAGTSTLHAFTMRSGDYYGRVYVENLRRATTDGGGQAYVGTDGDHEWRVSVNLTRDPAQLLEMDYADDGHPDEAEGSDNLRAGPILPWEVEEGAPSVGLFDISLGEDFEATVARSTFPFRPDAGLGNDVADGVAEVRLRWGDRVYDAGRVTNLSWYVNERDGTPYIKAVVFSHEDGLLELHEGLARARALRDWLERAGFTLGGPPEADERPPFTLVHPYRYDEQLSSWEEAEEVLADPETGIQGLDLYQMRAGDWYATVTLFNPNRSPAGISATDPVRQWDLQVSFDSELPPLADDLDATP